MLFNYTRILLFILSYVITPPTDAQEIKEYVLKNLVPINNIHISDTNYSDLAPIAKAIGDKRIVLLGEQDHGDAPTFLAKARLIKFLHEKMGFEVLAFESDFYGLTKGWEAYRKGELTIDRLIREIFPIWTDCDACDDVFSYVKKTQTSPNPLILAGFDNQLHGNLRRRSYKEDFLKALSSDLKPEVATGFRQQLDHLLTLVQETYPFGRNEKLPYDSLVHYSRLVDSLSQQTNQLEEKNFFRILVRSLKGYIDQSKLYNQSSFAGVNRRDEQMAENFAWLYKNLHPGRKVIIWAANYHIMRNAWSSMGYNAGKHRSMGNYMDSVLGKEMYVLGFTSFQGNAGRIYMPTYKVAKPKKNSMERWFHSKDHLYSFVDLSSFRPQRQEMFYMKGKGHQNSLGAWNEIYDGVFYIRDMYPCKKVN